MNKRSNQWHAMQAEDVLRILATNRYKGLRSVDAAKRRLKNGNNLLWNADISDTHASVFRQLFDITTVLFVLSVFLAAMFSSATVTLSVAGLLVFSVCVRVLVVLSTRKILRHGVKYMHPRCCVLRSGKCLRLFAEQIVDGDILLFSAGDTVPADVRLIAGALSVSEINLDKSRRSVPKNANDPVATEAVWRDRTNILYAASTVLSGNGVGVVFSVGDRTLTYAKNGGISLPKEKKASALRQFADVSRVVSFAMMLLCGLFLAIGLFSKQAAVPIDALFISSIALLVSSVSELLDIVALGTFAGAMRRVEQDSSCVIKSPSSMEAIAQTEWLVVGSERYLQTGDVFVHSCLSEEIQLCDCKKDGALPGVVLDVCKHIMISLPKNDSLTGQTVVLNECEPHRVMSALGEVYGCFGDGTESACLESVYYNGLQTSLVSAENSLFAYVCGSLDNVLSCCSKVMDSGKTRPITATDLANIRAYSRECALQARQTVAVARRISPIEHLYIPSSVQNSMVFLGCIAIENPVDPKVRDLASRCREGGVRIALLCDDPGAAEYLASATGLFTDTDSSCQYSAERISECLSASGTGNLLIRGTAGKKQEIVRDMQKHSRHVIYLGEGLRDLPIIHSTASVVVEGDAHRAADAVSRRADVLLQRGELSENRDSSALGMSLRALAACRGVFIQLRWILIYLLTSQTMRGVLALLSVCTGVPLLSATHILLLGCMIDFLAVIVMSLRPISDTAISVKRKFIQLPTWKTGLLAAVGTGVLSGLLLSLALLCMTRFLSVCDRETIDAIRLVGAASISITAMHICTSYSRAGANSRRNSTVLSTVCAVAVMILFALLVLVTAVRQYIPDWRVWPILFLPAAVIGIMLFIHKKTL